MNHFQIDFSVSLSTKTMFGVSHQLPNATTNGTVQLNTTLVMLLGHCPPRELKLPHEPFGEGALHLHMPKLKLDGRCIT